MMVSPLVVYLFIVMAVLVTAIHVFFSPKRRRGCPEQVRA
jgi:hypothetical protein